MSSNDQKPFKCWKCGACCKICNLIPELNQFDIGNGVCKNLLPDNGCAIYENRPNVCNSKYGFDSTYSKTMTWDEYLDESEKACIDIEDFIKNREY